jgi:hypothetical protein
MLGDLVFGAGKSWNCVLRKREADGEGRSSLEGIGIRKRRQNSVGRIFFLGGSWRSSLSIRQVTFCVDGLGSGFSCWQQVLNICRIYLQMVLVLYSTFIPLQLSLTFLEVSWKNTNISAYFPS